MSNEQAGAAMIWPWSLGLEGNLFLVSHYSRSMHKSEKQPGAGPSQEDSQEGSQEGILREWGLKPRAEIFLLRLPS